MAPAGVPYLTTTAKARAHLSGTQGIPAREWTILTLDTIDTPSYDPGSNFNITTHRFTAPVSGYYLCIGVVCFQSMTANKTFHLCMWKNEDALSDSIWQAATADAIKIMCTAINYLTAGDYIDLRVYTDFDDAVTAVGGGDGSRLEVHILSGT
jgi:hypothetical protein